MIRFLLLDTIRIVGVSIEEHQAVINRVDASLENGICYVAQVRPKSDALLKDQP